jgi:hypothetical protein
MKYLKTDLEVDEFTRKEALPYLGKFYALKDGLLYTEEGKNNFKINSDELDAIINGNVLGDLIKINDDNTYIKVYGKSSGGGFKELVFVEGKKANRRDPDPLPPIFGKNERNSKHHI